MNRANITTNLSQMLENYIDPRKDPRVYWAKEVTFDYATSRSVRVDYMKFKPVNNTVSGIEKGDFYCYEVKSCIEDFKSKNGHNFIGDYNYYVMPENVYNEVTNILPYRVGVLIPGFNEVSLISIKKAKRSDRERPLQEMLLMMYRSARRDVVKRRLNGE